jgi:hypothetical protein
VLHNPEFAYSPPRRAAELGEARAAAVLLRARARLARASHCAEAEVDQLSLALHLVGAADPSELVIGLAALSVTMQTCPELSARACAAGAFGTVVSAALLHEREHGGGGGQLFAEACRALACLVMAGAARDVATVAVLDAAAAVVAGMAAHLKDVAAQAQGANVLHLLWLRVHAEPACTAAAARHSRAGVAAALAAARAHPHESDVQHTAIRALGCYCEQRPDNSGYAVSLGALDVTLAAMRAHATDESVLTTGCNYVCALLYFAPAERRPPAAALLAAVGVVLAALRVLTPGGGVALCSPLATLDALSCAGADEEMLRVGVLEAVCACLSRALPDATLARALNLVGNLTATCAAAAQRAGSLDAVEACVAAVRRFARDARCESMALNALNNLMAGDAANAVRAHRAGLVSLTRAALDAHGGADANVALIAGKVLERLRDSAAAEEEEARGEQASSGAAGKRKSKKKRSGVGGGGGAAAAAPVASAAATAAADATAALATYFGIPAAATAAASHQLAHTPGRGEAAARYNQHIANVHPPPTAAATSSTSRADVAGPHALRVCLYRMCGDDAPALLRAGTLLDCMRDTQLDDLCGQCGDDVVVCLDADGAASALLRDVLLRKAPLPGFGLVPADWVPAEAHSNALLLALMAASPNAAALRRVWTAQRARGGDVDADGLVAGCFMLRLMRLLEAVCHSGMPWSAPDVDAAHAMAPRRSWRKQRCRC